MLEELHHHGYRLSPGTLYPMLARMAKRGWLRATEPKRSKAARMYRLTPRGHEVLRQVLESLDELYREVEEHAHRPKPKLHAARGKQPAPTHDRRHSSSR
jgi:DNA-binding PadR family transcriptional regulator